MFKKLKVLNYVLLMVFVISLAGCAAGATGNARLLTNTLFPQTGLYTITVVDAESKPIYGAEVTLLNPDGSGEWCNMGPTNGWGQIQVSGWAGITVRASYQETVQTGVFGDSPQTVTIQLPIIVSYTPPPTPVPQTLYSFVLTVNPSGAGIIGVSDGSNKPMSDAYPYGTVLTLAANRVDPYNFQNFMVDGQLFSESTVTVTITKDTTVVANFVQIEPSPSPTQGPTPSLDNLNGQVAIVSGIFAVISGLGLAYLNFWKK